jgi:ABC-2 type transport system permease protein
MNLYAVRAIYLYEMARTGRTLFQSIVSPVISTSLYFIVFGAAIGSRITEIDGVGYGSFIVPGLIMLMLLTQSVTNAAFGIYFPRFVGTIYELLSAPVSPAEIVLGYVGAAASKSIILGSIILGTSWLFVPIHIAHPFWMVAHSHAVQSARLLDQRLSLELFRHRRCAYPDQRSDDARLSRGLHGDRLVVLQDWVSP